MGGGGRWHVPGAIYPAQQDQAQTTTYPACEAVAIQRRSPAPIPSGVAVVRVVRQPEPGAGRLLVTRKMTRMGTCRQFEFNSDGDDSDLDKIAGQP